MLPKNWRRVPLRDIAEVRTGIAKGKAGLKDPVVLPYLRVANVQDRHLDLTDVKSIAIERSQVERYSLRAGDVLMTEGGDADKLGRGDVWEGQIGVCLHQNHVFAVRPNSKVLDSFFLAALASSQYGRTYFLGCAKQSTNLASINSTQLNDFPVPLPSLPEQRRIAEVLARWDMAIKTMVRLLGNVRQQKRALMRKLLMGKRHGDPVHANWVYVDFDSIFERITRKNTETNTNVLTISGEHGLIGQREFFSKRVASDNLSGYTLIRRGEFAYNRSYSAGYPFGAVKPLTRYESGVVSALYICFRLRDETGADPEFFRHYMEAGLLNEGLAGIAQEGARNHGLLNVSVGDFFKLRLHVPDGNEQRRIAKILSTAESEEQLVLAQLGKLRDEKRALMQLLLTGKCRLPLPEPAAETAS